MGWILNKIRRFRYPLALLPALACAWFAAPTLSHAQETAFSKTRDILTPGSAFRSAFAITGSQSYLMRAFNNVSKNDGFSINARGGFRIGRWGGFLELSWVGWNGYEPYARSMQSSLNFGLGAEVFYFQRRMRTALALGISFLNTPAPPDPKGTFGVYIDLTPSSYIIRPHENFSIIIAPLTLFIGAPALEGIPLIFIQYRTTVSFEFSI